MARADGNRLDDQLRYLESVADAEEFEVADDEAARLHKTATSVEPSA